MRRIVYRAIGFTIEGDTTLTVSFPAAWDGVRLAYTIDRRTWLDMMEAIRKPGDFAEADKLRIDYTACGDLRLGFNYSEYTVLIDNSIALELIYYKPV